MMKRTATVAAIVAFGLIACVVQAWAASKADTDNYIKQLKDPDPKVRATAADKLGCG